ADARSDGLTVALDTSPKEGAPRILAMFTTANNELSFHWAESGPVLDSAEEQLRRCVLEVVTASDTSYLSLAAPIPREPLGLENGIAKLELHSFSNNEFQFDDTDELFLGPGYVELTQDKLHFGARERVSKTVSITELPDDCAQSQAQVSLVANTKNRFNYELRLIEDVQSLPDKLQPLSENEQKTLDMLDKHLKKLKTILGQPRWWDKPDAPADIDLCIKNIGKWLGVADLPTLAGKPLPADPQEYARKVNAVIIDPAEKGRKILAERKSAVDSFRQKQHAQFKTLTSRAVNVAVMFYRRVETDTFAPCLLLGSREQLLPRCQPFFNFDNGNEAKNE
ncbi:MAG: hypothetical protein ACREHD_11605, partial [Pirellulales bacterium]